MYTHMNMQEQRISEIINQREPFAREIQVRQHNLQQQCQALKSLEMQYEKIEREGPQDMFKLIQHLALPQLVKKMEVLTQELSKPARRFARQTLNVGVVGRAGQGKSTLLQRLSDVGGEAIPSGDRGFCTGVRSVIQHSSDPAQKGGLIRFYTREEFLQDVLAPYYQRLGLGNGPLSVEIFLSQPLPKLMKRDALSQAMYEHLERYKRHGSVYVGLLGTPDLSVPMQEVRRYVAQDSIDGNQNYYEFMAVKEAIITTEFRRNDVGKVALVDMPGLGDTGVGDDERLMRALGEEIDVVLFVLMPHMRAELQDHDFQLYDLAHEAMGGVLPIEEWAFMVLNHRVAPFDKNGLRSGDNGQRCKDIKDKIESGTSGRDYPLKVVECIIADCSARDTASDEVLTPVLGYLAREMRSLDEKYMAAWRQKLCDLDREIDQLLAQVSLALDETASAYKEDQQFEHCFNALWEELTTTSIYLVDRLRAESLDHPNEQFVRDLQKIITMCRQDKGLPTMDEIPRRIGSHGSPINAFNDYLHYMRTHLTRHFMNIDDHTNFPMDEVKTKVAELFLSVGQLDYLFPRLTDKKELLTVMAIQPLLSEALRETFRMLGGYQLSLRGVFLASIRGVRGGNALEDVSPFKVTPRPPLGTGAQEIYQMLEALQGEAVDKIEANVRSFIDFPGTAACALGEEFIDQTLRAKEAKTDWRLFYKAHRTKIWPDVFAQSIAWSAMQQDWQMACQNVSNVHLSAPICAPGSPSI